MLPTGNRTGSVKMMAIRTGKLVTRDSFKLLPMPSTVIVRLNEKAASEGRKIGIQTNMVYSTERGLQKNVTYMRLTAEPLAVPPAEFTDEFAIGQLADNDIEFQADAIVPQQESYSADKSANDIQRQIEISADDLDLGPIDDFQEPVTEIYRHPDASVPAPPQRLGADSESRSVVRKSVAPVGSPPLRRNLLNYYQPGDTVVLAKEYAMKIIVKEALRSRGDEAERVILEELAQMRDKKVWTPMHISVLTSTEKHGIIRSQMFLKEKYLPTGEFKKLKACLVAGGNQQDKDLYDGLSSPTVSTSVVMTFFCIAAHEMRSAVVVDIGGAYLNADMNTGVIVHMRLDSAMSKLMMKHDSGYERYIDNKGCIVVRLDKALYGCVESAVLWYENLSSTLAELGYIKNEYEACVYCHSSIFMHDLLA